MCKISVRLVSLRQALASRAVLLQSKVPPEERWEQIPAAAVECQAARSPLLLLLPTNQGDSAPDAVSSGGLPPLPFSHPFAVCSSMLMAGQGHCQQPPGLVLPSHWCDHGEHVWSSPRDRAGRLGRPGSAFFSFGCWGCFSVGITLFQDSQYSSSPM